MRLENVKAGDAVAVYAGRNREKGVVVHSTATRVTVDYSRGVVVFLRRTGDRLGDTAKNRSYYSSIWAEQWTAVHDECVTREQVRRILEKSRDDIRTFNWNNVTQEQANAVMSAMLAAGLKIKQEDAV